MLEIMAMYMKKYNGNNDHVHDKNMLGINIQEITVMCMIYYARNNGHVNCKYAESDSNVLGIMVMYMIKYTGNNDHVHDIIC